jgi:hypothetical protein
MQLSGYVCGMQIRGNKIVAACWIAFSGLGTAITIKLGLPSIMAEYAHKLPECLTDPTAMWIGFVIAITAIGILLILAPWKSGKDQDPSPAPDAEPQINHRFIIEEQINRLLDRSLNSIAAGVDDADKRAIALQSIDHDMPTFIERVLG